MTREECYSVVLGELRQRVRLIDMAIQTLEKLTAPRPVRKIEDEPRFQD